MFDITSAKIPLLSMIDRDHGVSRRKVLECMTWAGTGVLWTVSSGVPHSLGIMGEAVAAEANGLNFLQISDGHVGFHLPPSLNALGTLEEAISKVNAQPNPRADKGRPGRQAAHYAWYCQRTFKQNKERLAIIDAPLQS